MRTAEPSLPFRGFGRTAVGVALVVGVFACRSEDVITGQMVAVFVDPVNPKVVAGDTVRIRASSTIGSPCDCRWTSSASGTASVDPTGLVRAVAPGRAVITAAQARFPEATASALVEVQAP